MGGQLAYEALTKLSDEAAERTTGILFSSPASETDIHNANRLAKTVLKRETVGKFLDRYRKSYWKMFAENKDTSAQQNEVQESYAKNVPMRGNSLLIYFLSRVIIFMGLMQTRQ